MLGTFVIGLREGLEAALIVGIIAAFLNQQGRRDLLRLAFLGVGVAVALCAGIGVTLRLVSENLPERQQEGLETVVGLLAVSMITYMIVWMRRNSRDLKRQLQTAAATALADGSGMALVAMAFLAVLREGIETVVFLLAAINESSDAATSGSGAALGIAVAVVLGYLIYRGGVRINLAKFFRITGLVLTVVAAGLVVTALHTAHEAGWLNHGQQSTVDLSWLVGSGSVRSSLLTGMLGLEPHPVLIEVLGWLIYVIPTAVYVAWPPGRALSRRTRERSWLAATAALAVAAAACAVVAAVRAPAVDEPGIGLGASTTVTFTAAAGGGVLSIDHDGTTARTRVGYVGTQPLAGIRTEVFEQNSTAAAPGPASMSYDQLAARNGGRLPLGLGASGGSGQVAVSQSVQTTIRAYVDVRTGRVVDVARTSSTTLTAALPFGTAQVGDPQVATSSTSAADVAAAVAAGDRYAERSNAVSTLRWWAVWLAAIGLCAAAADLIRRRAAPPPAGVPRDAPVDDPRPAAALS